MKSSTQHMFLDVDVEVQKKDGDDKRDDKGGDRGDEEGNDAAKLQGDLAGAMANFFFNILAGFKTKIPTTTATQMLQLFDLKLPSFCLHPPENQKLTAAYVSRCRALEDEPAGTVYKTRWAILRSPAVCQSALSQAQRLFPGCFIAAFGTQMAKVSTAIIVQRDAEGTIHVCNTFPGQAFIYHF